MIKTEAYQKPAPPRLKMWGPLIHRKNDRFYRSGIGYQPAFNNSFAV